MWFQAAGKYRQQGRNYTVEDGDIIYFKFNAGAGLKDAKKKWWQALLLVVLVHLYLNLVLFSYCSAVPWTRTVQCTVVTTSPESTTHLPFARTRNISSRWSCFHYAMCRILGINVSLTCTSKPRIYIYVINGTLFYYIFKNISLKTLNYKWKNHMFYLYVVMLQESLTSEFCCKVVAVLKHWL
jgi:hypothetical protein